MRPVADERLVTHHGCESGVAAQPPPAGRPGRARACRSRRAGKRRRRAGGLSQSGYGRTHTHTHTFSLSVTLRERVVGTASRTPGRSKRGSAAGAGAGFQPIPSRLGEPNLGRWPEGADRKKSRKLSCRLTAADKVTGGPGGCGSPGAPTRLGLAEVSTEDGPRHFLEESRSVGHGHTVQRQCPSKAKRCPLTSLR